jgi:hypothetical protein
MFEFVPAVGMAVSTPWSHGAFTNHPEAIIACDSGEKSGPAGGGIAAAWKASQIPCDTAFIFTVPTLTFQLLFCFFVIDHAPSPETSKPSFTSSPRILGAPGRTPVCILRRQATDQGPHLLADLWPARAAPRIARASRGEGRLGATGPRSPGSR